MICAIPGEMARLVEENKAGVAVEAENPRALAAAVEQILAMSEEERAAMGRRGRALVEREFSREKLAERLLETLR
ncbi:MAG: glycosyltransferase [Bacillota bacterium]|nr:glycosyltransferase [Bacillota bacterium]